MFACSMYVHECGFFLCLLWQGRGDDGDWGECLSSSLLHIFTTYLYYSLSVWYDRAAEATGTGASVSLLLFTTHFTTHFITHYLFDMTGPRRRRGLGRVHGAKACARSGHSAGEGWEEPRGLRELQGEKKEKKKKNLKKNGNMSRGRLRRAWRPTRATRRERKKEKKDII